MVVGFIFSLKTWPEMLSMFVTRTHRWPRWEPQKSWWVESRPGGGRLIRIAASVGDKKQQECCKPDRIVTVSDHNCCLLVPMAPICGRAGGMMPTALAKVAVGGNLTVCSQLLIAMERTSSLSYFRKVLVQLLGSGSSL